MIIRILYTGLFLVLTQIAQAEITGRFEKSINTKADSVVTTTFTIENLECHSDAANMEKEILQSKGVKDCTVDYKNGTAVVKYNAKKTSAETIKKIIENCTLCHDSSVKPFRVKDVKPSGI